MAHRNNSSSTPSSSSADVFTTALRLPITYSFVRDFLTPAGETHSDALINTPGGIQRASAVVLTINGSFRIEIALVPVFSRDGITLGVGVKRDGKVCPFAFHNHNLELLIIDEGRVIHFITEPQKGRRVLQFRCDRGNNGLLEFITNHRSVPSSISEGLEWVENRKRCDGCHNRLDRNCNCRYDTRSPSHPLDFSVFARNAVLFAGNVDGFSTTRRRGHWDQRIQKQCEVMVTVDERLVSRWWEIAQRRYQQGSSSASRTTGRSGNIAQLFVTASEYDQTTETAHQAGSSSANPDNGGTLRRIRNRESAARSNRRRKEKLDNLRDDLGKAHEDREKLLRRERELREQNLSLKRRVRGRGGRGKQ